LKGICPDCGYVGSMTTFRNEIKARQAADIISKLPPPVAEVGWEYLALYRPRGRAMSPSRALPLAKELDQLVRAGWVQHKARPARPTPPKIWRDAIDAMLARKNSRLLDLPLSDKDHSYLRSIVYDKADHEDRRTETKRNHAERTGTATPSRPAAEPEKIDKTVLRKIREERFKPRRKSSGQDDEGEADNGPDELDGPKPNGSVDTPEHLSGTMSKLLNDIGSPG